MEQNINHVLPNNCQLHWCFAYHQSLRLQRDDKLYTIDSSFCHLKLTHCKGRINHLIDRNLFQQWDFKLGCLCFPWNNFGLPVFHASRNNLQFNIDSPPLLSIFHSFLLLTFFLCFPNLDHMKLNIISVWNRVTYPEKFRLSLKSSYFPEVQFFLFVFLSFNAWCANYFQQLFHSHVT